jgi:hypothetical protein
VNRVGGDICIVITKDHVHNNQVMNVIQMVSNLGFGELATSTSNNEITCRTIGNLVCDMTRNMELAISPTKLKLFTVRIDDLSTESSVAYTLCMQVNVRSLRVGQELRSTLDKRDGSCAIVPQEDVQKSTTTNDASQVFMCRSLRQVGDKYSALILNWHALYMFPMIVVLGCAVDGGIRLTIAGTWPKFSTRLDVVYAASKPCVVGYR